jgi:peptidoglycan biosynthesis protein MviN/MurJ (putative lipid II flippase)
LAIENVENHFFSSFFSPFWLNFGSIENVAPEVLTQGRIAIIIALAN